MKNLAFILIAFSISGSAFSQKEWSEPDHSVYITGSAESNAYYNQILSSCPVGPPCAWYNENVIEDAFTEVALEIDYSQAFATNTNATTTVMFDVDVYTMTNTNGALYASLTATTHINQSLSITHNNTRNIQVNDKSILKFKNSIRIKIYNIRVNGSTLNPLPNYVELSTNAYWKQYVKPAATFSCNSVSVNDLKLSSESILKVGWNDVVGAELYEMEWTYVDYCEVVANCADNYSSNPTAIPYSFKNNSTRIITTVNNGALYYEIPLMYNKGYVVWRVRPIGQNIIDPANPIYPFGVKYGEWNISSEGTLNPTNNSSNSIYKIDNGFEENKSWQGNMSFAENGLKKEVVSFYDHTLRNRQSITRINSVFDDGTNGEIKPIVVGQSIYDFEGRPALSILPVPDKSTLNLNYRANFIKPLNSSAAYSWENFDKGERCDGTITEAMDNNYGPAKYYSSNNDFDKTQHLYNNYIPDAEGYPFSQTEYSPDNTGRIIRQGGVGLNHQLKGASSLGGGAIIFANHNTTYQYSKPLEKELPPLFGNEVGNLKHYQKNTITDPNGQSSVSIVDAYGRVVATSLDGDVPDNVQSLGSAGNTIAMSSSLLDNSQTNHLLSITETFTVTKAANHKIEYEISVPPYMATCGELTNLCYSCEYTLNISVLDACGQQMIKNADPNNVLETVSARVGLSKQLALTPETSQCSTLVFKRVDGDVNFDIALDLGILDPGTYFVYKTLSLNVEKANLLADQFIADMQEQNCIDSKEDIVPEANEVIIDPCIEDWCTLCYVDWTTKKTEFETSEGGINSEEQVILDKMKNECDLVCKAGNTCDLLYQQILMDVSPGNQYAEFTYLNSEDIEIVDYPSFDHISSSILKTNMSETDWKHPREGESTGHYKNYEGTNALVLWNGSLTGINTADLKNSTGTLWTSGDGSIYLYPEHLPTVKDFIANWQPSWAKALAFYHPEYCYYKACQVIKTSYDYDKEVINTSSAAEALAKGLFDPMYNDGTYGAPTKYLCTNGGAGRITPNDKDFLDELNALTPTNNHPWKVLFEGNFRFELLDYQFGNDYSGKSIWELSNEYAAKDNNCVTDLEWMIFKGLYMNLKYKFYEKYYDQAINSTVCNPTLTDKTRRFIYKRTFAFETIGLKSEDLKNDIKSANPDYAAMAKKVAQEGEDQCNIACASYASNWRERLSRCEKFTLAEINLLVDELAVICQNSCAESSTGLGARSSQIPTRNGNTDFTQAFKWWSIRTGKTLDPECTPEALSFPAETNAIGKWAGTKAADACLCDFVSQVETEFANTLTNCSIQKYFEDTYPDYSMDFEELRCHCYFEANPSYVPGPEDQCYKQYQESTAFRSNCKDGVNNKAKLLEGLINAIKNKYSTPMIAVSSDNEAVILSSIDLSTLPIFAIPTNMFLPPTTPVAMTDIFPQFIGSELYPNTPIPPCSLVVTIGLPYQMNEPAERTAIDIQISDGCGFNCTVTMAQTSGAYWFVDGYFDTKVTSLDNEKIVVVPYVDRGLLATADMTSLFNVFSNYNYETELIQNCWNMRCCGEDKKFSDLSAFLHQLESNGYFYNFNGGQFNKLPISTGLVNSVIANFQDKFDYNPLACGALNFTITDDPNSVANEGIYRMTIRFHSNCGDLCNIVIEQAKFSPVMMSSTTVWFTNQFNLIDPNYQHDWFWLRESDLSPFLTINSPRIDQCVYKDQVWPAFISDGYYYVTVKNECFCEPCPVVRSKPIIPSALACSNCLDCNELVSYRDQFNTELFVNYGISAQAMASASYTEYFAQLTNYINRLEETTLSAADVLALWNACLVLGPNDTIIVNKTVEFYASGLEACGSGINLPDPCVKDQIDEAIIKGEFAYQRYLKAKREEFLDGYLQHCKDAITEVLNLQHTNNQHHYTLYYYDRAGNLVKTVPPAGFDYTTYTGQTNSDKKHKMATYYTYNSLNQLKTQQTEDGGKSVFWYDALGRLIVSQNEKQRAASPAKYSYSLYDNLGRITEVGQLINSYPMNETNAKVASSFATWMSNGTKEEITKTLYDNSEHFTGMPTTPVFKLGAPEHMRNRVVSVCTQSSYSTNLTAYKTATHYSYDIHGNVKEVVKDLPDLSAMNHQFSSVVYNYDLLSGNVKKVVYQPQEEDQFVHAYTYDADNRLATVKTSKDQVHWTEDANYEYYLHGPLARVNLGQLNVQGIDYAYTIHGWLKTMNSESMVASNDAGEDGKAGSIHSQSARDAAGFSLLYYDNDYKKIGTGQNILASRTSSNYNGFTNDLYNGNIKAMATALPDKNDYSNSFIITPKSQVMLYNYDQLNRIKQSQSIVLNTGTNEWGNTTANPAYQSDYAYDYNGNILYLNRLESGVSMDQLTYEYAQSGDNNRLHLVRDLASSLAFTYDIDNQELPVPNQFIPSNSSTWNYQYDEIGNMISDKSEGITEIKWSVSGKIASIDWNGTKNLAFLYDASGQRVMKQLVNGATTTTTWYIRDASGNVMSTYSENAGALQLDETYIYGSSRIGSYNANLVLGQSTGGNDPIQMVEYFRGEIVYELSNHLGNVLAVITDRKIGSKLSGPGNWEHFEVDYKSFSDYYPYGMLMDGRSLSSEKYRFGFNTQEKDNEIYGIGNSTSAEFWQYDCRLGRRFNIDPKPNSGISVYACFSNNPIWKTDYKGDTMVIYLGMDGDSYLELASQNMVLNQVNDGIFIIVAHGDPHGIVDHQLTDDPLTSPEMIFDVLKKISPEFKKSFENKTPIALILLSCNSASDPQEYECGHSKYLGKKSIAQRISEAKPEWRVVGADGYVSYGTSEINRIGRPGAGVVGLSSIVSDVAKGIKRDNSRYFKTFKGGKTDQGTLYHTKRPTGCDVKIITGNSDTTVPKGREINITTKPPSQ